MRYGRIIKDNKDNPAIPEIGFFLFQDETDGNWYTVDKDGNVNPLLGNAAMPIGDITIVDQIYGDDATGAAQDLLKPFKTVTAARDASFSNTTIWVRPGIYDDTQILKAGVNYYCEPGVIFSKGSVVQFQSIIGGISNVYGHASFFCSGGETKPINILTGSTVTVECDAIQVFSGGAQTEEAIFSLPTFGTANVNIKANRISAPLYAINGRGASNLTVEVSEYIEAARPIFLRSGYNGNATITAPRIVALNTGLSGSCLETTGDTFPASRITITGDLVSEHTASSNIGVVTHAGGSVTINGNVSTVGHEAVLIADIGTLGGYFVLNGDISQELRPSAALWVGSGGATTTIINGNIYSKDGNQVVNCGAGGGHGGIITQNNNEVQFNGSTIKSDAAGGVNGFNGGNANNVIILRSVTIELANAGAESIDGTQEYTILGQCDSNRAKAAASTELVGNIQVDPNVKVLTV